MVPGAYGTGLQWVFSCVLMAFGLYGALCNWGVIVHNWLAERRGWRQVSMILFIPGLAGVVGMLACPNNVVPHFAWVPLLLDPTFPMAIALKVIEAKRRLGERNDAS